MMSFSVFHIHKFYLLIVILAALLVVGQALFGRSSVILGLAAEELVADAYVTSGRPTQSAVRTKYMLVGYDQQLSPPLQELQALLRFRLPADAQGKVVSSATLSLYLASEFTTQSNVPLTISVHLLSDEWAESDSLLLTWERRQQFTPLPAPVAQLPVAATPGWYQWNLQPLVQDWIDQKRGDVLGIILIGDAQNEERKRSFFTKDCSISDCGQPNTVDDKRPKLELILAPPITLPTTIPTPTSTPTPTPTSTPGIGYLRLRSEPTGFIAHGETLTYIIEYGAIEHATTDYELQSVVITNVVPAAVNLIPASLPTNSPQLLVTSTGDKAGSVITWTFLTPVPDGAHGAISYQVQRPTATPTLMPTAPSQPKALQITKSGPSTATPNAFIVYTLSVTNTSNLTATNVIITDRIPLHAQYVTGGVREGEIVKWMDIGNLAPAEPVSRVFVVTAGQTITNSDYGVQADDIPVITGTKSIVTIIGNSVTSPGEANLIINQGASMRWLYNGQIGRITSGPAYNPVTILYLPFMAKAK